MPNTTRLEMLTPRDWTEIYNALEGEDGARQRVREESVQQDLEDHDWDEIKSAVEAKYARLKAGFYGSDSVAREWRKQMARILSQLQEMRPEHRA
jgi:hypothetical protein